VRQVLCALPRALCWCSKEAQRAVDLFSVPLSTASLLHLLFPNSPSRTSVISAPNSFVRNAVNGIDLGFARIPYFSPPREYDFATYSCSNCLEQVSTGLPCTHVLACVPACGLLPGIEYVRLEWMRECVFDDEYRLDNVARIRQRLVFNSSQHAQRIAAPSAPKEPVSRPAQSVFLSPIAAVHLPASTNTSGGQRQRVKYSYKRFRQ
jgi:hypothetical protein